MRSMSCEGLLSARNCFGFDPPAGEGADDSLDGIKTCPTLDATRAPALGGAPPNETIIFSLSQAVRRTNWRWSSFRRFRVSWTVFTAFNSTAIPYPATFPPPQLRQDCNAVVMVRISESFVNGI